MNIDNHLKEEFKKLGKHIQKLRENKEISISELSNITGIRKEYLLRIEEGSAYRVLLEKHIVKIAHALNISLIKIFKY